MRPPPLASLLLLLTATVPAAVVLDFDIDRLRACPDATRAATAFLAAMPKTAREKLDELRTDPGWDPLRDLRRMVLIIPDQGKPYARLVGVPARRIAAILALQGPGLPALGGLGHRLIAKPDALFVALGDDQAMIGRTEDLAAAPLPEPLGPATAAIRMNAVPGPKLKLPMVIPFCTADLASDAAGVFHGVITADDEGDAYGVERASHGIRHIVALSAAMGNSKMKLAQMALAATALKRTGTIIAVDGRISDDLRRNLLDLFVDRLASLSQNLY